MSVKGFDPKKSYESLRRIDRRFAKDCKRKLPKQLKEYLKEMEAAGCNCANGDCDLHKRGP